MGRKDSDLARSQPGGSRKPRAPAEIAPLVAAARRNPNLNLGKVVLLEELGRGGMGVVWRGWQEDLRREVAVKLLPGGTDKDLLGRFQREARLASRLRHPNIVTVHDIGEANGKIYFTMDLVDGTSLDGLLKEKAFDLRTLLQHVHAIAEALDYAHKQGVVHRDIKPANILISAEGVPFLTDFGLAHEAAAATKLTVTGQIMGTPVYMSPEQARGQHGKADPRTDVYSLGAVLYEGLTGRPPVSGGSMAEIMAAILNSEVRRPSAVLKGIPPDVETICMKCLEKQPQARYGSAAELAADLQRYLSGESILARPPSAMEQLLRTLKRQPLVAAGAAAGLVAVIVLVAVLRMRTSADLEKRRLEEIAQQKDAEHDRLKAEIEDLKRTAAGMAPEQAAALQAKIRELEGKVAGTAPPKEEPAKPPEEAPKVDEAAVFAEKVRAAMSLCEKGDFANALKSLDALAPATPDQDRDKQAALAAVADRISGALDRAEAKADECLKQQDFAGARAAFRPFESLPSASARVNSALTRVAVAEAAATAPPPDLSAEVAALRERVTSNLLDRKWDEALADIGKTQQALKFADADCRELVAHVREVHGVVAAAREGATRLKGRRIQTEAYGEATVGETTDRTVEVQAKGGKIFLEFATHNSAKDLVDLAREGGAAREALGLFLMYEGDFAGARKEWKGSSRWDSLNAHATALETAALERDASRSLAELRAAAEARDWKKVRRLAENGRHAETRAWREARAEIDDWIAQASEKKDPLFVRPPQKFKDRWEWTYDFRTEEQLADWSAMAALEFSADPGFGVRFEKTGLAAMNCGLVFPIALGGDCSIRGDVTIVRLGDAPIIGCDLRGQGFVMMNIDESIHRRTHDRKGEWFYDQRDLAEGKTYAFEFKVDDRGMTARFGNKDKIPYTLSPVPPSKRPALWVAGPTEVIWSNIVLSGTPVAASLEEHQSAWQELGRVGTALALGKPQTVSDGSTLGLFRREDRGAWDPRDGVLVGASGGDDSPASLKLDDVPRNFRLRFRYLVEEGLQAELTLRLGDAWSTFFLPSASRDWQAAEFTVVERVVTGQVGRLRLRPMEAADPVEAGPLQFRLRSTRARLDDVVLRPIEGATPERAWTDVYSWRRPDNLSRLKIAPDAWKPREDGHLEGLGDLEFPSPGRSYSVYVLFTTATGPGRPTRLSLGGAVIDDGEHKADFHRLVLRVSGGAVSATLDDIPCTTPLQMKTAADPVRLRFEVNPVTIRAIKVREEK